MRAIIIICVVVFAAVTMLSRPIVGLFKAGGAGAERISFVRENGSLQMVTIGPGAPWPPWALRPTGVGFQVKSHLDPAPGYPSEGLADVRPQIEPRLLAETYINALTQAGWTVESYLHDGTLPDNAEQDSAICTVIATRHDPSLRSLVLTLPVDAPAETARLKWSESTAEPPAGVEPGPC